MSTFSQIEKRQQIENWRFCSQFTLLITIQTLTAVLKGHEKGKHAKKGVKGKGSAKSDQEDEQDSCERDESIEEEPKDAVVEHSVQNWKRFALAMTYIF